MSDRDASLKRSAIRGAAMFGNLDLLIELLPQTPASAHAEALGELVDHASVVGRNDVDPPLSDSDIARQTSIMGSIAAALIDADAGVPPVVAHGDWRVAELVDSMPVIAGILPIAGVVGWVWSHRMAVVCERHPAVAAYAAGQPLGLDDQATTAWAARRAAEHADAPWAMRLLAAIGSAA